jgi:hypothetical protein
MIRDNNFGKTEAIVNRVFDLIGSSADAFLGLEPADRTALMIWLHAKVANQLKTADVFSQYIDDRFSKPCELDQRELSFFDDLAYRILSPEFLGIELSPVGPLGASSTLTKVSQKNILVTIRNLEVLADLTVALALECALRRSKMLKTDSKNKEIINLSSSGRSLRTQSFEDIPGFTSHFKAFALCSGGRDIGHEVFETSVLLDHLGFYLDLLLALNEECYQARNIIVEISDIRVIESLIDYAKADRQTLGRHTQAPDFKLFEYLGIEFPSLYPTVHDVSSDFWQQYGLERVANYCCQIEDKAINLLRSRFPEISFVFNLARIAGMGYYQSLCFKISADNPNNNHFPLVDGGMVDWSQRLLQSKKERMMISGFGSELFCRQFKDTSH